MYYTFAHNLYVVFFFNDTATTEIYTLSLHDALPIYAGDGRRAQRRPALRPGLRRRAHRRHRGETVRRARGGHRHRPGAHPRRSEEHTSELQSRQYLVCRLLLEKKKK